MRLIGFSLLLSIWLCLTGCLSLGTKTIVQDRFNYNVAIRDSWEEQMLMNMVGLRYGEAPVFLDVDSVIAQYGLETHVGVGAGLNATLTGSDTVSATGQAVWSERPTITYTPISGQDFISNLLTPIEPSAIFGMIEAGWNAERALRIVVKSINGLMAYNAETGTLNRGYFDVLHAFKVLQDERALGIRREVEEDGGSQTYIYLRDVERNPRIEESSRIIVENLKLDPDVEELAVIFGPGSDRPEEIALQTLSVLDILGETAAFIQVPEIHVSEGRTRPNRKFDPNDERLRPPVRVYSSDKKPQDAVVAIQDRGYWFYVDDRDIDGKKAFSFLMIALQLSAAQQESRGPVVTIGAGN